MLATTLCLGAAPDVQAASIQIATLGADPLGRAGLEESVTGYVFERFGGALLLFVINAGVNALTRTPTTEVVIGSNSDAGELGATVLKPTAIWPTIKGEKGSPIRLFVARDLDFSPAGAVR